MKVLVQWSTLTPQDWREYDSAEWAGLPSKRVPAGPETMDNALGWVTALNCQDVSFVGYDHYACEDLPGGACRITAWKDDLDDAALDLTAGNIPPGLDPSQYGPADLLYARIWEFEPVARRGGRWNTLQRQTIYAGRVIRDFYAALCPVENTTVRPLEEFVPPPAAFIRPGVWMADELMRAHEQAQSFHPWMEWAPEPVIPQGPDHHSITYLLNAPDTADSCLGDSPGSDANRKMGESGQTSQDLSSVLTGGQSKLSFAFATVPNKPNSNNWPAASAGDPYRCDMNIVAAGADISYGLRPLGIFTGAFIRMADSTCANAEEWSQSQAAFTGTGIKSATNTTIDPAAGNASDRYRVAIASTRPASHGNQTLTLRTDASSFAQGPWAVGTTFFQTLAAVAVGLGVLARVATYPRSLTAVVVGVPVLSRVVTYPRTLAAVALGVPTLTKGRFQTLAATAVGLATLTAAQLRLVTMAAVTVGVAAMSDVIIFGKTLAAVAVGVPVFSRVVTYSQALVATAIGTATLTKGMFVTLAATALGVPVTTKGIFKTLSVTATGVPMLATALLSSVTMTATAMGVATLSAARLFSQTLAAVATGVASLVTEFIAGSGAIISKWKSKRWLWFG